MLHDYPDTDFSHIDYYFERSVSPTPLFLTVSLSGYSDLHVHSIMVSYPLILDSR